MATTIYTEQHSFSAWFLHSSPAREYADPRIAHYPYPRFSVVKRTFLNKVWDTVDGAWVMWESDYPDLGGVEYPVGHGTFGIDTSNYCVVVVVHGREQL